jgi:hypothetical protein
MKPPTIRSSGKVVNASRSAFEAEREGGYTDPAPWPQALMWRLFREGFDVECHRGVVDPVGGDLDDDPI